MMGRALSIGSTGLVAASDALAVTAHNLANLQTNGFRAAQPRFEDVLRSTLGNGNTAGNGTSLQSTTPSTQPGPITQTGHPLDIAVDGPGFLAVRSEAGERLFTRDGSLRIDGQGRLVTSSGDLVDPTIRVPLEAESVQISADGTVKATLAHQTISVGQIELVSFRNPEGLSARSANRWAESPASGSPQSVADVSLRVGAIEGSNVDLVEEMTSLITQQQAFQLSSQVVQAANERLRMLREWTS